MSIVLVILLTLFEGWMTFAGEEMDLLLEEFIVKIVILDLF